MSEEQRGHGCAQDRLFVDEAIPVLYYDWTEDKRWIGVSGPEGGGADTYLGCLGGEYISISSMNTRVHAD